MPVELTADRETVQLAPGKQATIYLTVTNKSSYIDTYSVEVSGPSPDWHDVDTSQVRLLPGRSGRVELTVHPPSGPTSQAGSYALSVLATSRADAQFSASRVITIDVPVEGQVTMTVQPPEREGRQAAFQVTVENQVNQPVTVALGTRDKENQVRFKVAPDGPVNIPAFADTTFAVSVAPAFKETIGEPHPYELYFSSVPPDAGIAGQPPLFQGARFTYTPPIVWAGAPRWLRRLPPWALVLLPLLAVALLLIIILFVLYSLRGPAVAFSGPDMTPGSVPSISLGRHAVPDVTGNAEQPASSSTLNINNAGTKPLTFPQQDSSIVRNGIPDQDFVINSDNCQGSTVSPGKSCQMIIGFTPQESSQVSRQITATLLLDDNAKPSPQSVAISATAYYASGMALSARQLPFPLVAISSTLTRTITVTDTGPQHLGPLVVKAITVKGKNRRDFKVDGTTCRPRPVQPHKDCAITVAFSPTGRNLRTATLVLSHNADGDPPNTVVLTGTGYYGSDVGLSPAPLRFGSQGVGGSMTRSITISDTARGALVIKKFAVGGGDFQVAGQNCTNRRLTMGQACQAQIRFTPTISNTITGTLEIRDNTVKRVHTVELAGQGYYPPHVTILPSSMNAGMVPVGSTMTYTLTLSNSGQGQVGPLIVSTISTADPDKNDLTIVPGSNHCQGRIVALGHTCSMAVQFRPRKSVGHVHAAVVIADNELQGHRFVYVGAGAYDRPRLTINPPAVIFPNPQPVGTPTAQAVTVGASGKGSVRVDRAVVEGVNAQDYHINNDQCRQQVLDAQHNCSIDITFSPTISGTRIASFTVHYLDQAGRALQATADITGNGQNLPIVQVVPSMSFASQINIPQVRDLRILNTGHGALIFTADPVVSPKLYFSVVASDQCTSAPVMPGEACSVQVAFNSTTPGKYQATLTLKDNASDSPQTVQLSGQAVLPPTATATTTPTPTTSPTPTTPPTATPMPTATTAPSATTAPTKVPPTSAPTTAPTTPATAAPSKPSPTVPAKTSPVAPATTAPAATTQVKTSPTAPAKTPVIVATLPPTAPPTTPAQTPSAACVAAGATLSFDPNPVNVGSAAQGQERTRTLTIGNCGHNPLTIESLKPSGLNHGDFTVDAALCTAHVIPAGGTCAVTIHFRPQGSGSRTASLDVLFNEAGAHDNPLSVPLSGTGSGGTVAAGAICAAAAGVTLGFDPNPVVFGSTAQGQHSDKALTIVNCGHGPLTITRLAPSGLDPDDFTVDPASCLTQAIPADGACVVTVHFQPQGSGSRTANLDVFFDEAGALDSPLSVSLNGSGT